MLFRVMTNFTNVFIRIMNIRIDFTNLLENILTRMSKSIMPGINILFRTIQNRINKNMVM